jgi:hypothetical protein
MQAVWQPAPLTSGGRWYFSTVSGSNLAHRSEVMKASDKHLERDLVVELLVEAGAALAAAARG